MPESAARPASCWSTTTPRSPGWWPTSSRNAGFGPLDARRRPGREALEALDDIDIVLLDHQLPDAEGLDVLDAIRARPNPPGVVLITAHGNESLAAAALRRGADDYLAKDPSLTALLPQILERVRRNRELRKALAPPSATWCGPSAWARSAR